MSLFLTIREMHKVLGQVNVWLDKAVAHATAKKFEPETMLQWRIAPDMFPLAQQIQFTCDQALGRIHQLVAPRSKRCFIACRF